MISLNRNPKILANQTKIITNSHSPIGFSSPHWRRLLTIKDIPLFEIGAPCETCVYYFKRLPGNENVNIELAQALSSTLNAGITHLTNEIVDAAATMIPDGDYDVILTHIKPLLCQPGDEHDFFSGPLTQNLLHFKEDKPDPQTAYYLVRKRIHIRSDSPELNCEFIVPTQDLTTLDPEHISYYRTQFSNGYRPTVLAIGLIETKWPYRDDLYYGLNFLTHYVIDGHHKLYAAALEQKEITMLSFIRKNNYFEKTDVASFMFNDTELSSAARLQDACANGNLAQVKLLIAEGVTADSANGYSQTPLHTACEHGRLDIVKFLIENGASIEAKNRNLETPIYVACHAGQFEIMKYLIEQGAYIDAKNISHRTPLHATCFCEHLITYSVAEETASSKIHERNLFEHVKLLVEHGAEINIKDDNGYTALDIARMFEFHEIADYLKAHGANEADCINP